MTPPSESLPELVLEFRDLEPLIETIFTAGNRFAFRPRGWSMEPFIHDQREKIILIRPPEADYRCGDIILYKRDNGGFVLHRIVACRGDGFILCGDAQSVLEYGIRPDMILARVEGIYRGHRLIDCRQNLRYRLLSTLWMNCRPFRRWLCALRHPIRTGRSLFRRLRVGRVKSPWRKS